MRHTSLAIGTQCKPYLELEGPYCASAIDLLSDILESCPLTLTRMQDRMYIVYLILNIEVHHGPEELDKATLGVAWTESEMSRNVGL